jgi:hypothetical protein
MRISFSTLYLLLEQRLNPINYYNQELIMEIFVWTTDYDMNIHAQFRALASIDICK